ncbi:sugar phosphate isomerase/epimerase family protein [Agathobaculum sp. NTUH-O15-33]|uniref:sugar phosphate isomerase/epimerase family protein n=1 Tax=Agathobaculum sp. NTUH-O15-33 TaxID=3079302 RepID=UPI0029588489|nr:sugar phosphate isomerase/epimerase family protein [Agathobaculum sp. NTUH-O15-33]WNX86651.1 sugar phosphate isomerase/epimerase family protein [Agathobaculum sp. NTUH-O15-33]
MRPALNGATAMKYPLETEIPAAAAAGFEGLELWWDKVVAFMEAHTAKELKTLLEENRIKAIGICPFAFSPFRETAQCRADIARGLEIASVIGCNMLTICPYGRPIEMSKEKARQAYAEELRVLTAMAAEHGVRLAIEPISGHTLIPGPLETLDLIGRAGNPDNLGTLVDTFHYSRTGVDVETVREIPLDKLFIVHVNDSEAGEGESLADPDRLYPTEGVLDLAGYMENLRATGYDGYLSVEVFRRSYWEEPIETICDRAMKSYKAICAL